MQSGSWARKLLMGLGFVLVASDAHAHSGEFLRTLAVHPTDPDVFAIRYENVFGGILLSRDGGKSVRIVPGLAITATGLRSDVPMLMGPDGKLMFALDEELHLDDGTGCALGHIEPGIDNAGIVDLARHPSEPLTTFMVTLAAIPERGPKHAGLWRRDTQGAMPLGASDPARTSTGEVPFRPTNLRVVARAASVQGLRFIEVGFVRDCATTPAAYNPVLRVSDDLGMSWTTHPIAAPGVVDNLRLLAVSGGDPFRALVAFEKLGSQDEDPYDPIYLTKDSGASFSLYLDQIQSVGEAVLLPSGRLVLGDRSLLGGGLWSASDLESTPVKLQDFRVTCLGYQETAQKLLLCTGYELGAYDLASNTFCSMFRLTDTRGFVACPTDPLEQNDKAKDQLCDGYCTAKHYATAPLCSSFDVGNANLCGAGAVEYDKNADYVSPPGAYAAPRCDGFPGVVDAGVSAVDAGTGSDAGDADTGSDAATDPSADRDGADSEPSEEAEPGEEPEADAGVSLKKKPRGCDCDIAQSRAADLPSSPLLALWLALWLAFRMRARRVRAAA
jgi:hypothetical protein